jgi:cysteine synthase B
VKDRPALWMIEDAERQGRIGGGRVLLDSTSGNTGIALATIAAARGYRLTLCLPANASVERRRLLHLLGAELILTNPQEGSDGARAIAAEMAAREPDRYLFLDQYSNPANWQAHYETTAAEIWRQTEGRITHLVSGLGTSGTFTGTSRRLRELKKDVRRIAVQPDAPLHGIEGMKHYESSEVPAIFDAGL